MGRFRDEPTLPTLLRILVKLLVGWLISLIRLLIALFRRLCARQKQRRRHKWSVPCRTHPSDLLVRPDVYIYSQSWLRAQGMAVTWNNPDIELRHAGVPVDSYHLEPDKEYDIVARVHNRSISSPAIGVRVIFSVRSFGIGGGVTLIGETKVDVSALGGASNPTSAQVKWRTPAAPGHYCIIAALAPPDDLNWADNEGQENTNVVEVSPGDPAFVVPVFNDTDEHKQIVLEVDSYQLPERPLPPGLPEARHLVRPRMQVFQNQDWLSRFGELFGIRDPNFLAKQISAAREWRAQRHREVVKANAAGNFPPPPEWNVLLEQKEITVPPKEHIEVPFSFRVPGNAQYGEEQVFNILGLDEKGEPVGGVTFIAKVKRP